MNRNFVIAAGLAALASLLWAGNWVLGRAIRADVPPFGLTFWRWTLAALILLPFGWRRLPDDWRVARAHLPLVLALGLLSGAMFQSMTYIGLHSTEAINALLVSATMPVFVVIIAFVVLRERLGLRQAAGVAVSFCGVAYIIARGEPARLLDLHLKDLGNADHPSNYDYTSIYDLVVFRRLASPAEVDEELKARAPREAAGRPQALASFRRVRTRAMGFVVFDRLLVTVHPPGCMTARTFIERYVADTALTDGQATVSRMRLPASPADLMLRMLNLMVDGYLDLRKQLSAEMTRWQQGLLRGEERRTDWSALMLARSELHQLEDLCEEQGDAVQEWLDTAREHPSAGLSRAERDALEVRANDVIEHIRRVVLQVRRMEQGAEAAVQIHFSAQSHRANNIMRTLTALTAIFLPLNLITGIFGMNFDAMPLLHQAVGFWVTLGAMAAVAAVMGVVFWRKRYLSRGSR